jgi:hypothetical protein
MTLSSESYQYLLNLVRYEKIGFYLFFNPEQKNINLIYTDIKKFPNQILEEIKEEFIKSCLKDLDNSLTVSGNVSFYINKNKLICDYDITSTKTEVEDLPIEEFKSMIYPLIQLKKVDYSFLASITVRRNKGDITYSNHLVQKDFGELLLEHDDFKILQPLFLKKTKGLDFEGFVNIYYYYELRQIMISQCHNYYFNDIYTQKTQKVNEKNK